MRRRTLYVLLLALAVAVVAFAGLRLWVHSAAPRVEGDIELAGLAAPVEIARDSFGVPHLRAQFAADLFFAQGWVHAQDRLWQMELFRRIAQGRLAEILGPALVPSDRFLRVLGIWRSVQEQPPATDPATDSLLAAYAAGVNAWIERHEGALPPEFLLLRFEPEPWAPAHTFAIERVMAWDLASWGFDAAAAQAIHTLGPDRARWVEPGDPAWGATILESARAAVPEKALALLSSVSVAHASNAWVIGGERTRSGKPILANDMHLGLRAPSVWYLVALHGGGFDVTGMSLPGTPFVIAGHNRAVAWGFTNAMVDDLDLFVEQLDPADSTRYRTPDGSAPFRVVRETIAVRGADTVSFDIRITRHGPVLETTPAPAGHVLAMQWAAREPSRSFRAIPAFNRAGNWHEFLSAVRDFDNPHQNVVYADTAGNIAYAMGGRVPLRGAGKRPSVTPVPGWTGEWDWNGWLPFERHPQALNPPAGFVVTANNRQVAGAAADLISTAWEPPFRSMRITEMVRAGKDLTAADVHAMQLDVYDALAERYRPLAVQAARAAGRIAMADSLQRWDLEARRDAHGAALFYTWFEALRRELSRDLFADSNSTLGRGAFHTLLDSAALPWRGHAATAAFDSAARRAAVHADSTVNGRTWGELHFVGATHALSEAALVERVLGLDVGFVAGDGSPTTVNVSHYDNGGFPVRAYAGASQRHVVDMADTDRDGGFILPTGQSGLPFSPHYRDMFPLWRDGGLWRIPLAANADARTVHRLTLRPAGNRDDPPR